MIQSTLNDEYKIEKRNKIPSEISDNPPNISNGFRFMFNKI